MLKEENKKEDNKVEVPITIQLRKLDILGKFYIVTCIF